MNPFSETLTGIDKVLYRTAYNFEMKYAAGATSESAHQAGLKEIKRIGKLSEELSKPQTYVDLCTGKLFAGTEAELYELAL